MALVAGALEQRAGAGGPWCFLGVAGACARDTGGIAIQAALAGDIFAQNRPTRLTLRAEDIGADAGRRAVALHRALLVAGDARGPVRLRRRAGPVAARPGAAVSPSAFVLIVTRARCRAQLADASDGGGTAHAVSGR